MAACRDCGAPVEAGNVLCASCASKAAESERTATKSPAKQPRKPWQDLYSGGIGILFGVVIFFTAQSIRDKVTSNPFSQWSASDSTWTSINGMTAFAALFVVAGAFYVVRGLIAQSKASAPTVAAPDTARAMVECPVCKELIREGATKCRYCGATLDEEATR